tara:strand:+ start:926 stop:1579 length:654 start_codon:yes stop_codon:yes gene_type:complete
MQQDLKLLGLSLLIGGLCFAGLMFWYQWSARSLSPQEVERYMQTISAQTQIPGGRHDLPALRRFLETDDGRPFYTINLYRFHDVADYPRGAGFGGTGAQAYDRFSRIMIRLLAARASHPVFGSHWIGASEGGWDRIVIVRYRSRRDIADLFASDAFADASLHKWAALESNQRLLAGAIQIPGGVFAILLLSALIAALSHLGAGALSLFTRRRRFIST